MQYILGRKPDRYVIQFGPILLKSNKLDANNQQPTCLLSENNIAQLAPVAGVSYLTKDVRHNLWRTFNLWRLSPQ